MITQVLNIDAKNPQPEDIMKAVDVLKNGGLVAFPTETVYGLGADFFNKKAVKKLYKVKRRPNNKPFTAHIADLKDMERFDCRFSLFAKELIEKFWPGPMTLVFETKEFGKIGFRMPDNKIAQELIRRSGTIIAAPSANISGYAPPTDPAQVLDQLKDKIDLVLDAGYTSLGKESTVIDLAISPYKIAREGAISKSDISETEFKFWKNKIAPTIKKILFICTGNSCRSVMAEGYLKKRLKQIKRDDIQVFSRGMIRPPISFGATTETRHIMKEEGVDVDTHKSTGFLPEDVASADLILVMERMHRDEIIDTFPLARDKVYMLAEFGIWGGKGQDMPVEIHDPIGRSLEFYKMIFDSIKQAVDRLVQILL